MGGVPWWVRRSAAVVVESFFPFDTARYEWVASKVLSTSSAYLLEVDLGELSELLPGDRGRGEVWLIQPMRVGKRVCFVSNEVEFDEQTKFSMYEVVMNAVGVTFLAFESNALQFLNVAPSQPHPEGCACDNSILYRVNYTSKSKQL